MRTTRRTMIKLAAGSAGALLAAPLVLRSTRQLFAQSGGNRVVVIGGGWGGLSAARWLKRNRPQTEVVLVEPYLEGTSAAEVSAALIDRPHRLLNLGLPRVEHRHYGSGAEHYAAHGLDVSGIRERIDRFLGQRVAV